MLAVLLFTTTANSEVFHYIYIEANEGTSSGGHVAVQFSDEVFHYQYQDGLIHLFKQDAEGFLFDYRYLQNRTLHVADVEVSEQTLALLHDHFKLLFWQQQLQFKQLQAAQKDQKLLEWLLQIHNNHSGQLADNMLQLKGAGLFFSDSNFALVAERSGDCKATEAATAILTLLRRQIELKHGPSFLQQRKTELTDVIHNLSAASAGAQDYTFSERYTDLLNGLLALRVLQEARPLMSDACHFLTGSEWQLDPQKLERLKTLQQRLLQTAQNLVISTRPDWGYALFVTLARLIALEQSALSGQWVFLDDFSEDSTVIAAEELMRFADEMRLQRRDAEADLRQKWQWLSDNTELNEQYYSQLEASANRYHEWLSSDSRHSLRYHGEQLLPVKAIRLPEAVVPELSTQQLQEAIRQEELNSRQLNQQLQSRYGYHLLTHNCVTEIFRAIKQALDTETEQRLGGVIDDNLYVIPFAAFEMVRATYPVSNTVTLPSYRQQQLAKQYAQEFAPLVYARESNVLSSSLYSYHSDDTLFVFFTDDTLLFRPLFGAVNSIAGFGQSLVGLLRWPFDDGQMLATGMRGVLMSLPELALINMRKGSYKFLSPHSVPQ